MYRSVVEVFVLTCCFIHGHVTCHDRQEPLLDRQEPLLAKQEPLLAKQEPLLIRQEPLLTKQEPLLVRERRVAALPKWVVGLRKPVFLNSPTNDTVKKGGNARLICRVQETKRVKWIKNGTELDLSQSKNYVSTFDEGNLVQTHVLQLQDIEVEDGGWYQCVGSNENGKAKSDVGFITVQVAPFFKKTPGNVTMTVDVKSKLSARLECRAEGVPQPEISWSKDGGYEFPAAKERRMHVMEDGESFFITEVKVEDQGVYSCRARNEAGEVSVHASLTVFQAPSFLKPLVSKRTRRGETSVLECMGTGSPRPSVLWRKEGEMITGDHRYFFTADNQLLIIVKSDSSDTGLFSCQLDNFLGSARQSMTLTVEPPLSSTLFSLDYFTAFSIFIVFISFTVLCLLLYVCALYCKPHRTQVKTGRRRSLSVSGRRKSSLSVSEMNLETGRRKPSLSVSGRMKPSLSVSGMNLNSQSQYYPPEVTIIPDHGTMSEDGMTMSEDGMTKIQGDDWSEECHSYYEDYQSE